MKALCLLALVLFALLTSVIGQESSAASRIPDDARFELVQVPWNPATTFRLDKYSGTIHRLGTCVKDDTTSSNKCWKEMIVIDAPRLESSVRPRFQIVQNAVLKTLFLLDVNTGITWQYALDATEKWHPFIDCSDRTSPQCLWRPLP